MRITTTLGEVRVDVLAGKEVTLAFWRGKLATSQGEREAIGFAVLRAGGWTHERENGRDGMLIADATVRDEVDVAVVESLNVDVTAEANRLTRLLQRDEHLGRKALHLRLADRASKAAEALI